MRPTPGKGSINIGPWSSIRKLMRAARRGIAGGKPWTPEMPSQKAIDRHKRKRRRD